MSSSLEYKGLRNHFIKYLKDIMKITKENNVTWVMAKLTKYGHPSHPLGICKNKKFQEFEIESYCANI